MAILGRNKDCVKLVSALGIDTSITRKMTLIISADEAVTIEVEQYATPEQIKELKLESNILMKKYELHEIKEKE